MNSEKILVAYFTRSGNTRILANEISRELQCDIEEIRTPYSYSGFLGYQLAFFHAAFKKKPAIQQLNKNPADYDIVIIGSPFWAGFVPGPIRTFLDRYKTNFNDVAFFLTQDGKLGQKSFFDQMAIVSGKKPLAQLAVSEKELSTGDFKESVSFFLDELRLSSPRLERKRAKVHTRPPMTTSP